MSLLKALTHRRGEPNKPCVQWQREIKMKDVLMRCLWGGISYHKAFWFHSSHVCKMCTLSHVCRGVMSATSRVKNLSSRRPRAVFSGREIVVRGAVWQEMSFAEGKGCVTGLVPENLSQPPSSWAAETPPRRGTTLAARFPPPHKPSTWSSQALPPHQDEERKERFAVSPPDSLQLGWGSAFSFFFCIISVFLECGLRLLGLLLSG